jgi:hypothetical protein
MSKNRTKPVKKETPFDFGLDAEQVLVDSLCLKFPEGGNKDDIDEALCGAFSALAHRMLTVFKKDYVLDMVEDVFKIAEEKNEEHVCDDCLSKMPTGTTSH